MKPGTPEMRNKDSDSSNNQTQEYRQKKQRERQEKLNKNRKDFLQDFESLETQFNITLSNVNTDANHFALLLARLDISIIKILDLLKMTNDLEIDLAEDIKNLISCASKCQNALTNAQMLNSDVFTEYTNQLKQALAVFKNNFVQICGFSNSNNNNETNYSPSNNSKTDLQPLPVMETRSNNQEDQSDMLPNETWIKILGFLNQRELTQIAQVSKRFNNLADNPDFFEKNINHTSFDDTRCFMVSEDGNFFVCNTSKKISLWNLKRGQLITQLSKNDDDYFYCTLSKNNQYILSYVYRYEHKKYEHQKVTKDYIQIWKIASKSIVKEFCVTSIRRRLIEKHECSGAAISNITFMSDDKLCLIMELFKIGGSHIGSYVIEYDIKSGQEKVVLLQNLTEVEQQALLIKSSACFRTNGVRHISGEHKINLNASETAIVEDIHFFKDNKRILCAMKKKLLEKDVVILDLETHSIEKISVDPHDVAVQLSSISLSPDERYVAVCGGSNILEICIKTTNYFVNIYDLKNENACMKTLNIEGAQCVFFTHNGLVVAGLQGINLYSFAELGCIAKVCNEKEQNNNNKVNKNINQSACSEFKIQFEKIKIEFRDLLSHEYFEKHLYKAEYIEKLKQLKNDLTKLYEFATELNLPHCNLLNDSVAKLTKLIGNSKELVVHCYTEYVTPARKYFSQFENLFFLAMNDNANRQQSDATKSNQIQVNEGKHEIESDEEFTNLNSLSR